MPTLTRPQPIQIILAGGSDSLQKMAPVQIRQSHSSDSGLFDGQLPVTVIQVKFEASYQHFQR